MGISFAIPIDDSSRHDVLVLALQNGCPSRHGHEVGFIGIGSLGKSMTSNNVQRPALRAQPNASSIQVPFAQLSAQKKHGSTNEQVMYESLATLPDEVLGARCTSLIATKRLGDAGCRVELNSAL